MAKRLPKKSTERHEIDKGSNKPPVLGRIPLFLSGHPLYLVSFLREKGYHSTVLFDTVTLSSFKKKQVIVLLSLFDLFKIKDILKNLHRRRIRLVLFSSPKELDISNKVSINNEVLYFRKKDISEFEPYFVNMDVIKKVIKYLPIVGKARDNDTLANEVSILKNLLEV